MLKVNNELIAEIKELVQTIPGVVNFSTFENDGVSDALIINENKNDEIDIRIAIIINRNTSIINITNQIYKLLEFKFRKHKISSFILNLYIKGVK